MFAAAVDWEMHGVLCPWQPQSSFSPQLLLKQEEGAPGLLPAGLVHPPPPLPLKTLLSPSMCLSKPGSSEEPRPPCSEQLVASPADRQDNQTLHCLGPKHVKQRQHRGGSASRGRHGCGVPQQGLAGALWRWAVRQRQGSPVWVLGDAMLCAPRARWDAGWVRKGPPGWPGWGSLQGSRPLGTHSQPLDHSPLPMGCKGRSEDGGN